MSMHDLKIEIDFDQFPPEYTCDGAGISPRIRVTGSDAPYLAIIMEDPDASKGLFTHWTAWNIPSTEEIPRGIPPEPEVAHPISAVQGMNDSQKIGYSGPCPHPGKAHRYFIRVWSLERELDLAPGAERIELTDLLSSAAVGYGEAMATYGREKTIQAPPTTRPRT